MSAPRLASDELAALLDALRPAPVQFRAMALSYFGLTAAHDNPDGWIGLEREQAEQARAKALARFGRHEGSEAA